MDFRPCIDLHDGKVKQIVGSTLNDDTGAETNFVSERDPAYYAKLYKKDNLKCGHVIMLGPGNEKAALSAISAYPGGLQIGGGINNKNAADWIKKGASHVIVTSYVFKNGTLNIENLGKIISAVGKGNIVLDLSCRKKGDSYFIVTDRWQKFTDLKINKETLHYLAEYCSEFLIHAVDVEGKQAGIDADLISIMADFSPIKSVYAGGIRSVEDIEFIEKSGRGRIAFTIGSALDIFGGTSLKYSQIVQMTKK